MWRFSEVIDDLDLRDLSLQRGPFTWSGGLNSQSMSRLDRFLVTKDWECHFSGVVQYTLRRPVFDHFPILLDREGVRRGLTPFCFKNVLEGAIGDEDAARLEEAFNEKKVFSALFELNRDKAPGPDGFSIAF
ncbi:hypothetical protein CK203_099688 [Vitis vinifera]|uniref:Endonuclease/exonuclease/phosphatase domain-containing protein n=1 Tax=Vitis vinifera TaxID=29760 RepID=A0A438FB83_VITVI|nr:hypothetical protein CK203_099688 [Vitis vinifera]